MSITGITEASGVAENQFGGWCPIWPWRMQDGKIRCSVNMEVIRAGNSSMSRGVWLFGDQWDKTDRKVIGTWHIKKLK